MSRGVAVTVRIDGRRFRGQAVDLREADGVRVDGQAVAAAIRTDGSDDGAVAVDCPDPRQIHERVGYVRPEMSLRVRTALAAAGRSRGVDAPQDDDLRAARDQLAALEEPDGPDVERARARLAGTDEPVEELRERVAALRGRVAAAREAGRDAADLQAELSEAVRELSERETERLAAREQLERARERARDARSVREERRRLEDRIANLERAARAHLVDELRDEFAASVAAAPGSDADEADPFDAGPVTAALAVGRVARLRAPVVLGCERFRDASAAADWLDAPVIRV